MQYWLKINRPFYQNHKKGLELVYNYQNMDKNELETLVIKLHQYLTKFHFDND